nr:RpiB/LacA/LacB family sugar-phosphate isomerase [uncultured Lichenicoccus sp.]
MRIVLGGDSAGEPLIQVIKAHLTQQGVHEVVDLSQPEVQDEQEYYAEMTDRVAQRILDGGFDRGILACGTGIGVSISANKIPGIRAALTHDTYSAERAALSNDAHIITMGARVIGPELAKAIVDTFLAKQFDPKSKSAGNVEAIKALDIKYAREHSPQVPA